MIFRFTAINEHSEADTHWIKRLGLAGFMFFFLKGLLWLLIPWLAHSAMF